MLMPAVHIICRNLPIDLKIENLDKALISTKIVATLVSNTRFLGPLMAQL